MTMIFPRWEQLPDLDLYLDQVLLYVNQVCQAASPHQEKTVTAAMVNNYVKHQILKKPIKKKYHRDQIARLIVITILKPVFALPEIGKTLAILRQTADSETLYNAFVDCMNDETVDFPVIQSACHTIQLYQQTHQLIHGLKEKYDEQTL